MPQLPNRSLFSPEGQPIADNRGRMRFPGGIMRRGFGTSGEGPAAIFYAGASGFPLVEGAIEFLVEDEK